MLQLQRAGEDVNVWFASLNARLELEGRETFYIDEVKYYVVTYSLVNLRHLETSGRVCLAPLPLRQALRCLEPTDRHLRLVP